MAKSRVLSAEVVIAGAASGHALVSATPLSFWGGYDAETGEVIDRRHPLSGRNAAGRVLVVPSTRGSSTTAAVLLEAVRRNTAPAAVVNRGRDTFLALTSIVADEMYGRPIPIVSLEAAEFDALETDDYVTIAPDGRVVVEPGGRDDEDDPDRTDAAGGAGGERRG